MFVKLPNELGSAGTITSEHLQWGSKGAFRLDAKQRFATFASGCLHHLHQK